MKLGIQGNSLRIRVTRPDFERLERDVRNDDMSMLGPKSRFEYAPRIVIPREGEGPSDYFPNPARGYSRCDGCV